MRYFFAPLLHRSIDLDLNISIANQTVPLELNEFEFHFAQYCELTIDAMTFLLSYVNQLCARSHNVSLFFDAEDTIRQFSKEAFFSHLDPSVKIDSVDKISIGQSYDGVLTDRVIKVVNIIPGKTNRTVPTQLADTIKHALKNRPPTKRFDIAVFTIFGELIDNILQHSSTKIDGFAGVEIFDNGRSIRIAVSDSGSGILQTLRPSLTTELPKLTRLKDTELLLEVFKKGVSRHGQGRGCGLKTSADWAIKFDGILEIRLSDSRIALFPDKGTYALRSPMRLVDLPLISGTHICLTFTLDM